MAAASPLRPIVLRGSAAELGSGAAGPATTVDRPAEPAHLSIPELDVHADIERVGSTATGTIEVPQVGVAGWFDEGPRPGEPGRAVVIGHLDSQNGPGLFALLPGVKTGADISVTDAAGAVHRFQVIGKAQVPKANFPSGAVYGPSDTAGARADHLRRRVEQHRGQLRRQRDRLRPRGLGRGGAR